MLARTSPSARTTAAAVSSHELSIPRISPLAVRISLSWYTEGHRDMLGDLRSDPKYRAALAVARRLREAGHEAYFAGGCVRDLLLGVAPKDYDVATSAVPE